MSDPQALGKVAEICTYLASGGLVAGDALDMLDHHAAAFGVLIALATYVTSVFFQMRHLKSKDDD